MERQNIFHDRQARGRTRTGWLQSFHTFSFGSFLDPTRMGFSALRVINEDLVAAGSGFPEHGHDHFEILTFMLTGELEHRDSAGNVGHLGPGDVQLISSGTGIRHSERNPSVAASTHLFQVWLHGNADGEPPRYQHTSQALLPAPGAALRLVASATAEAPALRLRAPVVVWAGRLESEQSCAHDVERGRSGWLQCLEGVLRARVADFDEDFELRGGDALQLGTAARVDLEGVTRASWLWFDLP